MKDFEGNENDGKNGNNDSHNSHSSHKSHQLGPTTPRLLPPRGDYRTLLSFQKA
jgi:hypothetical protein